jgi:hypothetical protein
MRNAILVAVCATAIGAFSVGAASAQTTGPVGQDSTKMSTDNNMSNGSMSKTQGMSKSTTSKTHKSMKKDKMMKSDSMSK